MSADEVMWVIYDEADFGGSARRREKMLVVFGTEAELRSRCVYALKGRVVCDLRGDSARLSWCLSQPSYLW